MVTKRHDERQWKAIYRQAVELYNAGQYVEAADLLSQVGHIGGISGHMIKFYHARACRKAAEHHVVRHEFQPAGDYLARANEINPNSPTLVSYLAQCYAQNGQHAEAAEKFRQVADIPHSSATMRFRAAINEYLAGHTDASIDLLRQLTQDCPQSFDVAWQLGLILAADGRADQAVRFLTHASMLRPELPDVHTKLALAHGMLGHAAETVSHLQRAHTLDPANHWTLRLLTLSAERAKHFGIEIELNITPIETVAHHDRSSLDVLAEKITVDPEFVTAFLDLPPSEMDEEIFGTLLMIVMKALEHHPEFADLHYHCSKVYDRLGQTTQAILHSQQALDINPRFVNALIQVAKLYEKTDRDQLAIDRLQAAIANGANYADVHYMLGRLYHKSGRRDEARTHYQRAISLNSGFNAARDALASLAAA